MKPKCIEIASIIATTATQIRAKIDCDAVEEYAEAMRNGAKFPPIVVFQNGSQFILADGFHRLMAHQRAINAVTHIMAMVHEGGQSDALQYALGANTKHGLRRTNADKRRSVEMALTEWPKLSDNAIASMCGVDNHTVAAVIDSLGISQPEKVTGRDGKTYKLPVKKPVPAKPKSVVEQLTEPERKAIDARFKPSAQPVQDQLQLDKTSYPIPQDLQSRWDQQTAEVKADLAALRPLIEKYEALQTKRPLDYFDIDANGIFANLKQLRMSITAVLPYAVCPYCHARSEQSNCSSCHGKGWLSEFFWQRVPEETREMRKKARAA